MQTATLKRLGAWACAATLLFVAACSHRPSAPAQPAAPATLQDLAWLDRLTWGATPADVQALQRLGRDRWLTAQLNPGAPVALPAAAQAQIDAMAITRTPLAERLQALQAQRKAADALADDAQKEAARKAYQQQLNTQAREAASRMLLRALHSPQQLREQMTWFWFNHFNVHQGKHALRAVVGDYDDALRAHALGRFKDLLRASALHPAMLLYLDNAQNAAGRLNENFARELLELHTLGVDGGYTQRDVQDLARVLTGLGVRLDDDAPPLRAALQAHYWREGLAEFHPRRHDFGDKQVLGHAVRGAGITEVEQVLDRLSRHPSTARHVCTQLALFFVADEPAPALVQRMSQRFLQTDGDIAQVLRTMIESPEFNASLGGKFKDPLHYVVSAARTLHTDAAADPAPLLLALNRLGQLPYNRQTPDGYPMDRQAWAAPGQMNMRFEIARALAARGPAQRAGALYRDAHAARLSDGTRQALAQATTPQEWNGLLLASPEFMHR